MSEMRISAGELGYHSVSARLRTGNAANGLTAMGSLSRLDHVRGSERDSAELAWNRSEEHTSELQSLMRNSYAVFCLTKKILTSNAIATGIRNLRQRAHRRYVLHVSHSTI